MQIVGPGASFNYTYGTVDNATGLSVGASVYDVTTGTPEFLEIQLLDELPGGVYVGSFEPEAGSSYLVIMGVYTDDALTTAAEGWSPAAENYLCMDTGSGVDFFGFNYGSYDENHDLYVAANVYELTDDGPTFLEQVPMLHVALGVYFGEYAGEFEKSYALVKRVYTSGSYITPANDRAPGTDSFQGFEAATGFSTDPGINNVVLGVEYEINGEELVGVRQIPVQLNAAILTGQSLSATLRASDD
jgi:hypothetical protein